MPRGAASIPTSGPPPVGAPFGMPTLRAPGGPPRAPSAPAPAPRVGAPPPHAFPSLSAPSPVAGSPHASADGPPSAKAEAAPAVSAAHLALLGKLATELDGHARRSDVAAIRVVRQRLTEWIEDVRSVGGGDALAKEVEALVVRLSAALAAPAALAAQLAAIVGELLAFAAGGQPPTSVPRRPPFWK